MEPEKEALIVADAGCCVSPRTGSRCEQSHPGRVIKKDLAAQATYTFHYTATAHSRSPPHARLCCIPTLHVLLILALLLGRETGALRPNACGVFGNQVTYLGHG
jgi:hypothetical protein